MAGPTQQRSMLGRIRRVPDDLVAVLALTVVVDLSAVVPSLANEPLWMAVGLVFMCFLPGYAVVSALFPRAADRTLSSLSFGSDERPTDAVTAVERVGLSFGLSLAVVVAVGLVLNASPGGIQRVPALAVTTAVILLGTGVALVRRSRVPPAERFDANGAARRWVGPARRLLTGHDSRGDGAVTAFLVVSLLLAVGAVGFAATTPTEGERYTELYLLTETDDGELVFDDYPTTFAAGEPQPVVVRVRNHEFSDLQYTVVVQQQRVEGSDDGTVVADRTELDRLRTGQLDHDDTWTQRYDLAPTATGDDVRLVLLLYRGSPPADATVENAYRHVTLQVTVTD